MRNKIKVALLGNYPSIKGIYGGTAAVTYLLASGLKKYTGIDVEVITLTKNNAYQPMPIPDVPIHVVKSSNLPHTLTTALDRQKILQVLDGIPIDLIHVQGQDVYAWAALSLKRPKLLTIHGLFMKEIALLTGVKRIPVSMVLSYLENYALSHTNDIVCCSPYVESEMRALTKANFYYIENPLSDEYFEVVRDEVKPILLYVGGIRYRKGILYLLEAMQEIEKIVPEVSLHIVGSTSDRDYAKQVYQFIADHNLSQKVKFLGHISEKNLLKEYSQAFALVLPSLEETAPVSISQAMAASLPVLASKVGGIPYMVTEGETGFLFEPRDPVGIVEAVRKIFSNSDNTAQMGSIAKAAALKRFGLRSVSEKTSNLYHHLLER